MQSWAEMAVFACSRPARDEAIEVKEALERIEWSSSWSLAVSLYYVLTLSIELDLSGIEAAFCSKLWSIASSAKLVMP